ncbi:MAG: hypothetical protein M5U34_09085 [Chloroflexi bacterium]|nr:hypothetical protein [Chloroflexota bacterium]
MNRDKMERLVEKLLEVETLDRADFEKLMNQPLNGHVHEETLAEGSSEASSLDFNMGTAS